MKQLKIVLAFLLTSAVFSPAFAQTADEIVAKHIETIGGADAWRKINSLNMEGTMTVQGAEVQLSMITLHGKGSRQNIAVAGMTGYTIITPTAGWSYLPFQGQTQAEAITEEQVKEGQDQLDAQNELVDYAKKGSTIELLGKDDVDGTECFKIKVVQKNGVNKTVYIDTKSYYLIRQVTKQTANGQEMDVTTDFSNFKKIPEGIVVPMSIMLPFGELSLSKVEVNKPVDEAIFKPSN